MDRELVSETLLKVGLWMATIGVVVQSAAHLIWAYAWESMVLSADSDVGAFAWASSVAIFSASLAALVLAALGPERGLKLALAAILGFFSLDDIIRVHELLSGDLGSLLPWERASRAAGMIVFLPLMAVVFVVLWRLSAPETRRSRGFIRCGLALLVAAAFLEAIRSALVLEGGWDTRELPMVLEVIVEEGAELGGWILIATALATIGFRALTRLGGSADQGRDAISDAEVTRVESG